MIQVSVSDKGESSQCAQDGRQRHLSADAPCSLERGY